MMRALYLRRVQFCAREDGLIKGLNFFKTNYLKINKLLIFAAGFLSVALSKPLHDLNP